MLTKIQLLCAWIARKPNKAVFLILAGTLLLYVYTSGIDSIKRKISGHSANTTSNLSESSLLPTCPETPPNLIGKLEVSMDAPSFLALEKQFLFLEPGGKSRPRECLSRYKVAVIVPYRNRDIHLRVFLHNIHPFLHRQQLDYGIYVVEQCGNDTFNRGLIKNIGFEIASKDYAYDCFIFHDVDLIPENDQIPYACLDAPTHLSRAIDIFNYKLPRALRNLFGGVIVLTRSQFQRINGYPNDFWGWGGEDNDLFNRAIDAGLRITRYSSTIARYKMLNHSKDSPNPQRYSILKSGRKRWKKDGLSNLHERHDDLTIEKRKTHTRILARVKRPKK